MGTSLLPLDVWVRVIEKLETDDIVRCRAVCRQFHDLSVESVLRSHTKLWIMSTDTKLWFSRCTNKDSLDLSVVRTHRKKWIFRDIRLYDEDCFDVDHRVPPKNSIWIDFPLEIQEIEVISRLFPSVSVLRFYQFDYFVKYDSLVASLQLFPNIVCLTVNGNSDYKEILQMEPTGKLIHLKANSIISDDGETELKNVFPSLQSLELDDVDNGFVFPICSPSKRAVFRIKESQENSFHWSLFASSLEVIEAVIDFGDYSRKYQPSHPGLHSLSVGISTREEEQREGVNLTGLMNFILDNKQSLRNLTFSTVNASRDSFESLFASLFFISKLEITFNSGYVARSIRRQVEKMPSIKHLSLVYIDNEDSAYFTYDVWPYLREASYLDNLSIQRMDRRKQRFSIVFWSPFIKCMLQPKIGMKQVTLVGIHFLKDEWQKAFDKVEDHDNQDLMDHKILVCAKQENLVVTLANEPESEV